MGALWFDYDTLDNDLGDLSGRELDVYAQWGLTDNLMVIPLVGLYQPKNSADNGGTQLGSNDRNLYTQLMFALSF